MNKQPYGPYYSEYVMNATTLNVGPVQDFSLVEVVFLRLQGCKFGFFSRPLASKILFDFLAFFLLKLAFF